MKIGIISDTHDQQERTRVAVKQLQSAGAEVLIHCGDLIEPEMIEICAVMPFYFVFGNNDCDRVPGIRAAIAQKQDAVCLEWGAEIELDGKRIAVTHGHSYKDFRRLLALNPDYFFSGHSHIAADFVEGTTRRINPGALHRAESFSVAILDLASDKLKFLAIPKEF